MPTVTRHFDEYRLRIYGTLVSSVGARLWCYDKDGLVGRIDFYPDGVRLPMDRLDDPEKRTILLNMPMSRFDAVMDTVRLEKPLWLLLNYGIPTPGSDWGMLGSDMEPVGEEETI